MALIAVTGAAGRIGTAIRPLLLAARHSLVLCDVASAVAVGAGATPSGW